MLLSGILDFIFPRFCVMCNKRLLVEEDTICLHCNMKLPRTNYWETATSNPLAQQYEGRMPIEKAASFVFYRSHSDTAKIVYAFKYNGRKDVARGMGKIIGKDMKEFLADIDFIVPIPLSKGRMKERGYNQSAELAKGISNITGIGIIEDLVKRNTFEISQTMLTSLDRRMNISNVFEINQKYLTNKEKLSIVKDRHILIIDDIITTCATTLECAKEIKKIPGARLSILSFGFAH